jgi:hypothetical protein
MEIIMGAKVSELKKPELKTGGGSGGSVDGAVVVEKVDNGYVLRLLNPVDESETVMVFQSDQRQELLSELSKYI